MVVFWRKLVVIAMIAVGSAKLQAAEWQWSVPITGLISGETGGHPSAFLWIPPDCRQVRGIVVGMHNMQEEGIMEHPIFRDAMAEIGFAEIWVSPGLDPLFDPETGAQEQFERMLNALSDVSGYEEIRYAPVVPIGHSAWASYPWNFAAWNPTRTLAILSIHGDAPQTDLTGCGRTNLDWGRRTIDGIPGLMVMGEYEWWEDRLTPAITYKNNHPQTPVSLLADAGHGHFDHSDMLIRYLALFVQKAAKYRLPAEMPLNRKVELADIDPREGWLVDRWHADQSQPRTAAAAYPAYRGEKATAFWYFDEEMAQETLKYYAKSRGKKSQYLGIVQADKLLEYDQNLHARYQVDFKPKADGLTFHINAIFTDSLHEQPAANHAGHGKINIDRICGPVEKINDSTFTVRFYRMGLDNAKRTGEIWLLAHHKGDDVYKSAVQQLCLRIPYPNQTGNPQHITVTPLSDVGTDVKRITIQAVSDRGLPVYHYVKSGPARILGNEIILTDIPPRAKYPVEVSVVSWQYGIAGQVQTAEPVESKFSIIKGEEFAMLDSKLHGWLDSGYYDGLAVAVARAGSTVYQRTYGTYSDTSMVHVASAGKWIAAAVIAAVVDEGVLSWDDRARRYIAELTDAKGDATLRQLLSHTAGYPDYQPENRHRDDYQTLEEAVRHIVELPADTLPGTIFRYGGLAMQVAGRMAELATGKDWETLFQEKIARRLGMTRSHFTPVSSEPGFNPMLGGGFRTCLRDYMRFLAMMTCHGTFEGARILSKDAVAEIVSDQVKRAKVNQPEYVLNARQNTHHGIYGLGVWREEEDKEGNATLISSPGWAGAFPWIDRKYNAYGFLIAKVKPKAITDGFSAFYESAVLPTMVRDVVDRLYN